MNIELRCIENPDCSFKITEFSKDIIIVDIKTVKDLFISPGDSIYIDTGMKILSDRPLKIFPQSTDNMYENTRLNIFSHIFFLKGNECVDDVKQIKFVLHNYEFPVSYPPRVVGDRPVLMKSNKVKLITGEEATLESGIVSMNSYHVKANDYIAKIIITKL